MARSIVTALFGSLLKNLSGGVVVAGWVAGKVGVVDCCGVGCWDTSVSP